MKLKDVIRRLTSPRALREYWELQRIRRWPRYRSGTTRLFGPPVEFIDSASFGFLHEELFVRRTYAFASDTHAPRIIDGGANIGLSVLFFKQLYPQSTVVAFEADRRIFEMLRRNVTSLGLQGVELHHAALWREAGEVQFCPEGADAGRVQAGSLGAYAVPAVPLAPLLEPPVDLLKLDIEGAEFEVLQGCADRLGSVGKMFVEYHSVAGQRQRLPELLLLLQAAGFRSYLTMPSVFSRQPLVRIDSYSGFDMVVNVFATRAGSAPAHR